MDGTTNKSLYRFAGIGLDTHLKDKLSAVDDESDQIEWWRTLSATASQNKTDRKGNGNQHCRHGIPNRVEIDERPQEANNRPRIGDWEMDLIVGTAHRGAILTMIQVTFYNHIQEVNMLRCQFIHLYLEFR